MAWNAVEFERAQQPATQTDSERDNLVRYRAGAGGHVESHFLKANSPDGQRALWIKHTLLVPKARPERGVAEVWAIGFSDGGRRKVAEKRTFQLHEATLRSDPFGWEAPCAALSHGRASGHLHTIAWDLSFACPEQGFRPFPLARMYSGRFPRSKSLTPVPDARVHGSFRIGGERWEVTGWPGAQGHNWGASHAYAYAWVHANVLERAEGAGESAWFEALSGRVRLGPGLVTPFLNVAALALDGEIVRFDGLRALCSRRVAIDGRSYRLELAQGDVQISARFAARAEQFAGLRYEDPDGTSLACLNSKLATGEIELRRRNHTVRFYTSQAALELGTRRPDHGIELLV